MHDIHFILTYSISVYSFWNGSKSHLPHLYKIQESHLIVPETYASTKRACKVDPDRQTYWYNVWANACCKA